MAVITLLTSQTRVINLIGGFGQDPKAAIWFH